MLPFLVAESLVVETQKHAARMPGDEVVDIVGVAVDVAAEVIDLDVSMAVILRGGAER